jgi:DNA-binding SARP family transcriptional activator
VEFRILGPLEVLDEAGPVALGTMKERVVLAVLLLHANEVVSRERLVDELWGESPPPTARKAVNVYVSQLRKGLARNGTAPIETLAGGYRLSVPREHIDAGKLQRLLAVAAERASAGDPRAAADLLRQALLLWRGRTLAGLELESVGRHEIEQWEELRMTALMDRIDCDLALGRHEQLVGELNRLVAEHPVRERLRAQQMLALYRADRQADALEAYQQARHALVEGLGIEPSSALQRLQKAILAHDAALELATGTGARTVAGLAEPTSPGVAEPEAPSRRLRRRVLLTGAVVLVLAAGATAVATRRHGHAQVQGSTPALVKENSLLRLDPTSGRIVSETAAGVEPGPIGLTQTVGAHFLRVTRLWVVSRGDQLVSARAPDGHTLASVGVPGAYDVAAGPGAAVWVSERKPFVALIERIGSGSGSSAVGPKIVTVRVPGPAAGDVAVGGGYLWVIPGPVATGKAAARVSLVSTTTHRVVSSIPLNGETTAIAYGFGAAWVGTYDSRSGSSWVTVVKPGSAPESVRVGSGDGWGPLAIGVGGPGVWVLTAAGALVQIGTELRVVKRFPLAEDEPEHLAVGGSAVWVVNGSDFSVSEFNPSASHQIRRIRLGSYARVLCGIAATSDGVWITVGDSWCDPAHR